MNEFSVWQVQVKSYRTSTTDGYQTIGYNGLKFRKTALWEDLYLGVIGWNHGSIRDKEEFSKEIEKES